MGKWETPRQFVGNLATREERRSMDRVRTGLRTCEYCKGVFKTGDNARACERWHKDIFRRMRSDLTSAINRLTREIDSGKRADKDAVRELKSLGEKLRDVPKA